MSLSALYTRVRLFVKTRVQKHFKILFPLVHLVAVAGLALFLYKTYNETLFMLKEQFNNQQELVAKQTAATIEGNIKFLVRELQLLAQYPALKHFLVDESRKIIKEEFAYLQDLDVSDVGLLDAKGIIRVALTSPQLVGSDFSYRDFFKQAKQLKKSTAVFEFVKFMGEDTEQKGITVAMPILSHEGEFNGVVTFIIKVSELIKGFVDLDAPGGQSCVIDSGGNILCDPKKLTAGNIFVKRGVQDPVYRKFFEEVKAGRVFRGEYLSPRGVKTTAVSYPIRIGAQTWSIIIATPETVLTSLLRPFTVKYTLAMLVLLLAVALASFGIIYGIYRWNIELDGMVKHRTHELTMSEKKLRDIVETINDLIWEINADYRFTYVSPIAHHILGFTAEEMLGKTIFDLMPERDALRLKTTLQAIAESREPFVALERVSTHKNGKQIVLETNGVPIFDDQGHLVGFRGADRDIVRRKQAEQELQQYADELEDIRNNLEAKVEQRTKELKRAHEALVRKEKFAVLGELASSVSHELRNPLGVIKNAVYFFTMRLESLKDTAIQENIKIINREIAIANKIITDLLDFTRERPSIRLDVDLNQLVREMLAKSLIPDDITVVTNCADDLRPVSADPTQVAQILLNLIENAVQAMDGSGTLAIATRAKKQVTEVVCADTGCGIPKKDLNKIFEPLFTTKAKGIGLGLAVSKNMAEANGATIVVESTEGKGSTFILKFVEDNQRA